MEGSEDWLPGFLPRFSHFATQAIHAGQEPERWSSRAVVPPISLSTTFKQRAPGQHAGFEYSRSGNPTRDCLEKAVAALDGAKYCLAYASGSAATVTIAHLLKAGDAIICMDDVYGGTYRYFRRVASEMGLKVTFVDCTKLECLEAAITPETKIVWIETPSNPMLKVIDIQSCADVVHKHKDVILVIDNTFMSAYFQRPLSLGADICMYSATKYMNGHSDVVMGLVSVNCDKLYEKLKFLQNAIGAVPSPFDCYLCNRGLKTLHIRMKQHFQNALAVAQYLESDSRVEKVIFPGLPSHPQHELVKRQCAGCPGMITFYIKGKLEQAVAFLKHLKLFALAESLGGYESLAEHPAVMTHAAVSEEDREALGITDTLIRLSIGLEDKEDLLEDLDQALKAAFPEYTVRN
ncbi:cystathionine gamma-lyase isoform X1 [Alligator mississippiensis]|uniref:Cystathionine gamma-lyase n=1 Tax=Alligator mississippiensis TaxID=8496 RepID=A0A151NJ98_ALLMI|nr:cystathionine gamma-lyase isoform X1 [Alligator mississippiensis]KYO36867.1 cystathionine gamma-lyase [Alligator mississippiensis]